MATERSLGILLRALQSPNDQDASRLLASAATLLTLLNNPLNVSLLTLHVLSAPAIWHDVDSLQSSFRVLAVFSSASSQILQYETNLPDSQPYLAREGLAKEDWVKAVVRGVDEKSPQWRHILVLGGLLAGFEANSRGGLPLALRRMLEGGIVKAANIALQDTKKTGPENSSSICVVLSYVLDILSDYEKTNIDHVLLLPLIMDVTFSSSDGLHWGYFLGIMDADVIQDVDNKFNWSSKSATYYQVQRMASNPILKSFSSISRLAALCVQRVANVDLLFKTAENLAAFTRSLCVQWQHNKLSEVDFSEESTYLSEHSITMTLPLLWQVLKSSFFAVIIIQQSLIARVLGDRVSLGTGASFIAIQTLHVLRNLHFISSRLGQRSFSQYYFVYLAAIDLLSHFPLQAQAFLYEIRPAECGRIPAHPHSRCQDLYFLNTAEHFAIFLPMSANEELLIPAAVPYLLAGKDPGLLEIFESAHSVMLAVFAVPGNFDIVSKHLTFYVETLLKSFPFSLSPRQFRLAIKTLMRVTAPPSLISEIHPLYSSALLEVIYDRSKSASDDPLPPLNQRTKSQTNGRLLSEKAVLIMTLIDSLSALSADVLQEWLPLIADAVDSLPVNSMFKECSQCLWEVLSNGETDMTRAAICAAWWNTHGGRERLLLRDRKQDQQLLMSGASQDISKL